MRCRIAGALTVPNPTEEFAKETRRRLEMPNPKWVGAQRMGFSTWGMERSVRFYEEGPDGSLTLPAGLLGRLRDMGGFLFEDCRPSHERKEFTMGAKLRGYQEEAVGEMLRQGGGVLVSPCGSGKTQMGLAIASRLGLPTLWLTHTKDLLRQSMGRAASVLAFPGGHPVGSVTEGRADWGECMTFATVQTMASLDAKDYEGRFGTVIVDECHHAVQSVESAARLPRSSAHAWRRTSSA